MKQSSLAAEWITEELLTVDFKDKRLDRRMGLVLEELSHQPEASPHGAASGHKEMVGTYRFFDNPKVTLERVLAPHHDGTLRRMSQYPRVLVVQDTTELDFSQRQEIPGAGYLSGEHGQGFYLHPLIAFSEQRLCLGALWAKVYSRPQRGVSATCKQRPLADKESVRWLEGYQQACAVAQQLPQTQVVCISDAEGDIYEALLEAQPEAGHYPRGAQHITRAAQDRRTHSTEGKLWAELLACPVLGQVSLELPRRAERAARKVSLEVRAKAVRLCAPERRNHSGPLPDLEVWGVLAREIRPPAGVEPVEWLLLSSLPVSGFEEAVQVLQWYSGRWEIEVFFRVFKSGCQVERLQLESGERLWPAFALYLIIAWRILYLTRLGRATPQLSCAAVFEEAEWKAVWVIVRQQPLPAQPPVLAEMIGLVATLGGYKGRKADGPPGPKAMWVGLRRVFDLVLAWNTFGPGANRADG